MALYDKLAATAFRLLNRYGTKMILRQLSSSSADYDPSTGIGSPSGIDGSTDADRKGLVLDQPGSQISQRFGTNNQGNTLIQQGEKWLYLDAKGSEPAIEDKIIIKDIEYTIIDVQEIGPGGVAILYMLVVRK